MDARIGFRDHRKNTVGPAFPARLTAQDGLLSNSSKRAQRVCVHSAAEHPAASVMSPSVRTLAGHMGAVGDGGLFPALLNMPPQREGEETRQIAYLH